jgi:hypothetical protein
MALLTPMLYLATSSFPKRSYGNAGIPIVGIDPSQTTRRVNLSSTTVLTFFRNNPKYHSLWMINTDNNCKLLPLAEIFQAVFSLTAVIRSADPLPTP